MSSIEFKDTLPSEHKEVLLMLFNRKMPMKRIAEKLDTTREKIQAICRGSFKTLPSTLRKAVWEISNERIVDIKFLSITLDEMEIVETNTKVQGSITPRDPEFDLGLKALNELELSSMTVYDSSGNAMPTTDYIHYLEPRQEDDIDRHQLTTDRFALKATCSTSKSKNSTGRFNTTIEVKKRHQDSEDLDFDAEDLTFQLTFTVPVLVYASYSDTNGNVGRDTIIQVSNDVDQEVLESIVGGEAEIPEKPTNDFRVSVSSHPEDMGAGKCIDLPMTVNGSYSLIAHLHFDYSLDKVRTGKDVLYSSYASWFKAEVRRIMRTYVDGPLTIVYLLEMTSTKPIPDFGQTANTFSRTSPNLKY